MLRCASCVPHPVVSSRNLGSHAELNRAAKYVFRPDGTREYRHTIQRYPRFLQMCCRAATRYLRCTGGRVSPAEAANRLFANKKSAHPSAAIAWVALTTPATRSQGRNWERLRGAPGHVRDPRQKLHKLKLRFAIAYQPPPSPRSRIQPPDTPSLAAPTVIPVK